jgi:hypothetical protein
MRPQMIDASTGAPGLTIWDCLVLAAAGPFADPELVRFIQEKSGVASTAGSGVGSPRRQRAARLSTPDAGAGSVRPAETGTPETRS